MTERNATAQFFQRQAMAFRNNMQQSCATLVGIVHGMLSDGALLDVEIRYLRDWLAVNENIRNTWPGSALYLRIEHALADGRIDSSEREHLVQTLQHLIGGTLDEMADSAKVCRLALDDLQAVELEGRRFCLTGDFAYGPRSTCEDAITRRGGLVLSSVSGKLHYLVVGGLGSPEWKHGTFGTKIARAVELRHEGKPLRIVHEDALTAAMFG